MDTDNPEIEYENMALPSIVEVPWMRKYRLAQIISIASDDQVVIKFLGCSVCWTVLLGRVNFPRHSVVEEYNNNPPLKHWDGERWTDGMRSRYGY